jgi:hypothetical protein
MNTRPVPWTGIAALSAVALLSGCIVVDDNGRGGRGGGFFERTVDYRCDDNRGFSARFDDREVRVRAGRADYDLELERGNRRYREYEGDNGVRLTVDGDEARLRIPDQRDYAGCEAD